MRPQPPRLSVLRAHFRFPISPHSSLCLSSTARPPSLLTVRNIPAPHLGHIRILSLNNPRSRNAISRQLLSELRTEIDAIREQVHEEEVSGEVVGEGTRVLVLASEVDEAFCAGADLKERRRMSGDETQDFLTKLRSTFDAIETLPIPTIAAVASLALGGGLELALATDLRVFASTAMVGLPETRLGIIPGAGGTYRLQKLIGKAAALDLILTARPIAGHQAHHLGLAQHSVKVSPSPPHQDEKSGADKTLYQSVARTQTLAEAVRIAEMMCQGAPGAVQAALRAVREGTAEAEGREYGRVVRMGDRDEALRAFGEARGVVWRGR